jgi:dissimilatory sulfite reductase (desulfoviridin) alpha/beta subunit
MEFCGHCRAPRKTRKSTRVRSVHVEGAVRKVKTESHHCVMCGHVIRSVDLEETPR